MWESYAEVAHCVRLDRFFSLTCQEIKMPSVDTNENSGGFVYIWKISSAEVNMLH